MKFLKTDDIYKVIRISGSQDNILGISFGKDDVEVIEWNFNNSDKSRIRTSKEEVLKQVLFGLESVNKSLGTNYKISKIYFSPFDIPANSVYSGLTGALIRHFRANDEIFPTLKDLQIWNLLDEIHLHLQECQIDYRSRSNSRLIDQLNWEHQEQYIELLEEYLKCSSSFFNFIEKYRAIVETAKKLETKSIKLTYHYQAEGFSNHILALIQLFDSYQTGFEISSKIFEYWVRKILVEMKNHYG